MPRGLQFCSHVDCISFSNIRLQLLQAFTVETDYTLPACYPADEAGGGAGGAAVDEWAESLMPYLPPNIVAILKQTTATRGALVELSADVGRPVRVCHHSIALNVLKLEFLP